MWESLFSIQWVNLAVISISALEKKCPVCLGLFDEEDEVKQLPCSHRFHSTCIVPWLQRVSPFNLKHAGAKLAYNSR